jgi:hypothetical protein
MRFLYATLGAVPSRPSGFVFVFIIISFAAFVSLAVRLLLSLAGFAFLAVKLFFSLAD